jgi:hypothetical protein
MIAYLDHPQGVVIMTNGDNGSGLMSEILTTLNDEYGWQDDEFTPTVKTVGALDTEIFEQYVGRYVSTDTLEGGEASVVLEDNRLWIELPWGTRSELLPESETGFFLRDSGAPLEFLVEDGEVVGLLYARSLRADKVE